MLMSQEEKTVPGYCPNQEVVSWKNQAFRLVPQEFWDYF